MWQASRGSGAHRVALEIDTAGGHQLLVSHGGGVERYDVVFESCPDPVCCCFDLDLVCTRAGEGSSRGGRARVLTLDLGGESVSTDRRRMAPADLALARGLVAGLSRAQWQELRRLFIARKRRAMERCDLGALDIPFLPEERDAQMMAYDEVFRWAERFELEAEGQRWFVEDLHCVQPGCTCHDVVLLFYSTGLAGPEEEGKVRPSAALEPAAEVRYDLESGATERDPGMTGDASLVRRLMAAMKEHHPGFSEQLVERRRILRSLYRRFLRRAKKPAPAPARISAKVGRNDPCPCGSGKKYKRCCGPGSPTVPSG